MVSSSASITSLNTSLKEFFFHWVMFTRPMHNLTLKESEVLAALLCKRYELSKAIIDETILNKFLFSQEIKESIMKESDIKSGDFSNALSRLRKKDVITAGNLINPRFVPNLKFGSDRFDFLVMFNITDNQDNIDNIIIKENTSPIPLAKHSMKASKIEEPVIVKEVETFAVSPEPKKALQVSSDSYEDKMKKMFENNNSNGGADLGNVGIQERRVYGE